MNSTSLATLTAALSVSLLLSAPGMKAQDAPAAAPSPSASPSSSPGAGGGAQDFLLRMMQRRDENIKTALKVKDDEWAVIQPLLDKVQQAQFAAMMSGNIAGGFGRPGGGPGAPAGGPGGAGGTGGAGRIAAMFPGSQEVQALSEAVQSGSASADDLKAKMAAVRAARKKTTDDLAAARADLQKVLSLQQEAVLLSMGILE